MEERWFVYIARCRDGSLYTGVTVDLAARERAHNAGRGGSYTRSRRPIRMVLTEGPMSRSAALRREAAIKRLRRRDKLDMVRVGKGGRGRKKAVEGGQGV